MILKRVLLLPLFAGLIIINGCGSSKKTASAPSNKPTSKQEEENRIKTTYMYFDAMKEKLVGNPEKAAEQFALVLRTDPKNHAAMYELASIYNDGKRYADALFFSKQAADLSPDNEWYQLLLADSYENNGKAAEAGVIFHKLSKEHPDRLDYQFQEAETFLMQNKLLEAIKLYDQIEEKMGVNRDLTSQKQRLYLKLGNIKAAANEIEKLIASDPQNIEYYTMLVDLYSANNMKEETMKTITRMQAIDPENPTISLALAEQYRANGQKAESFEQLKKAFSSKMLSPGVKIRILTSYFPLVQNDSEMMGQAMELSKRMSDTHPQEASAQAVYGDFLSINRDYAKARDQYRLSLAIDKQNLQAWQQLMLVESDLQDYVAMEKESEEALGLFADQSVLYLFNGIAKIQNKKYDEAAKTLLSGSKMVVDNDAQLIEFYSNLGDVYNKLKRYEDSDKYYDKGLKIDPSNANILNNWAYYLSLRKADLEKAAEMSKKSNELIPNNPSNEDTYAWVLFVQGKYVDAKLWIEKALEHGGNTNGTILEHYGDVLFKLGNIDSAVSKWKEAKATGDHSEQIDKKISDKKFYE
jgi:tetratricopeptide (TPR) repeat protein